MGCARRRARVAQGTGRSLAGKSVAYCGSLRQRHRAVKNLFQHVRKQAKKRATNACEFSRWRAAVKFRGCPSVTSELVLLPSRPDPKVKVTHSGSTAPPAARSAALAVAYWS